MRLRNWWRRVVYSIYSLVIRAKWFILGDYYYRLGVQARYLYKQSPLFKMRWQEVSLEYAENSFNDVSIHFFNKVQKEPAIIKQQILKDFLLRRPARPYYILDN